MEGLGLSPAWRGRRVLVTGHTGFKGAWLCLLLEALGAHVHGVSDRVPTAPSLFEREHVAGTLAADWRADVCDAAAMAAVARAAAPEVVLHLAAQSVVAAGYADPVATFRTNVVGTLVVLEAARAAGARVVVVVTSDKCYELGPEPRRHVESDPLGGHDPYSASKAATELAARSYARSYPDGPAVVTVRAGNVIGGGDFTPGRIVPDLLDAARARRPALVRRPDAVRPWQHVLAPLHGYLLAAERAGDHRGAAFNLGPDAADERPVRHLADRLVALLPGLEWTTDEAEHPHEAPHLALDSTKARDQLGWRPRWALEEALLRIAAFERGDEDARAQIAAYGVATTSAIRRSS